jgi:hypothetical protein
MFKESFETYVNAIKSPEMEGLFKDLLNTIGLLLPTIELACISTGEKRCEHLRSAVEISARGRTTLQTLLWEWEGLRKLALGEVIVVRAARPEKKREPAKSVVTGHDLKAGMAVKAVEPPKVTEAVQAAGTGAVQPSSLGPLQIPIETDSSENDENIIGQEKAFPGESAANT